MQPSDTGAAPSLVEVLSGHRLDVLLLLALWAALLWSGTQLPQADVPFAHTDGATRGDLLALSGLGLHRVAGSLPAWLLTAATIVVALARLLPVLAPNGRAAPSAPLDHPIAEAQLAPRIRAVHAGFRDGRSGDGTWVLGHAAVGRWLLAAGATALLVGWLLHGLTSPAVLIETRADGTVYAHTLDANRPGPRVAISGRCRPDGAAFSCSLAEGDVTGQPSISAGQSATFGGQTLTWVGQAPPTIASQGRLRWMRTVGDARPAWYGFDLPVGSAVDIPALSARAALVDGARAGPVIAASVAGQALLAAAPGLITGPATMRLDPPPRLRMRLGDVVPPWWWLVGALLALVGVVFLAMLPAAEVRLLNGRASVVSCNQPALRGRLERALQAAEEAS